MLTDVYPSNLAQHATLVNATPYKTLYGKDAHLGHRRAIGAGGFVHIETHTEESGPSCLGRTPCRVQHGQHVVSGLQLSDLECPRKQERYMYRDAFSHA